ncbi:MAG TPA: 2-amino-4-hydroxy-6-hydroxymethyldihydropteridine diphosphokinase [Motilibacteraceae bacterium]|nr:2-amino-4-hydroxy-6-hydroxymethyldihydropteridine diphosphokinase [Motilibacteraceae bacterium]
MTEPTASQPANSQSANSQSANSQPTNSQPASPAAPAGVDAARSVVDTITDSLRPIRRAALSLGSNVGDTLENLQGGLDSLLDTPGVEVYAVSPLYETDPVGGVEQPPFLNAVVVLDTTLSPRSLLDRVHAIEEAYGRDRSREERWGPRTLDIDVLAVGDRVIDDRPDGDPAAPGMVLPHPRLAERAFVLAPWNDVDPSFEVPGRGRVRDLLAAVGTAGVSRRPDLALDLSLPHDGLAELPEQGGAVVADGTA